MFCLNDTMRYHLCPGRTDMRKGINSLIGVVKERMGGDVRNGDVFIFIGGSGRLEPDEGEKERGKEGNRELLEKSNHDLSSSCQKS